LDFRRVGHDHHARAGGAAGLRVRALLPAAVHSRADAHEVTQGVGQPHDHAIAGAGAPASARSGLLTGQAADSNLYPSPRTVTMCCGRAGSVSILARSRLMCTSSVLVSPT